MIKYFENILCEIDYSVHSLDDAAFARLLTESVATINDGHKIVVSGLGKNVPICDKFVGSMVSLGMDAAFLHTNSAVHGDMGIIKDGDLVIILTKSGSTAESVFLYEKLSARNINLWLLTFSQNGILSKLMNNKLVLKLRDEGDLWDIMPNNSTTVNLIILQGLVMQIAKERGISLEEFKRNHPGGVIGEKLNGKSDTITP
jgi:arabinose-5-phosphate isomerase